MLRPILFVVGWLCFVLGVIGAFMPILPTTPFLLLAGVCFSRSSPRFHAWLLAMPVFGAAMEDWRIRRVIRVRAKVLCSTMLLASLWVIWSRATPPVYVKVPATLVIVGVGTFVVTRKSR